MAGSFLILCQKNRTRNLSQGRHNLEIFSQYGDIMEEYTMRTLLKSLKISTPIIVLVQEDMEMFIKLCYPLRGSLQMVLSNKDEAMELDWKKRLNIVKGVVNALSYMHHNHSPPIFHRDISNNNVLLDLDYEAHISDFGTARL
ncbi:MDIS1-interacting receptor like kinase 2-like [Durio zibethinus]|uniref:non-specific serine/threonine protein kinase n=1 Tax=Durio zibethinus TaxID=66656 RepID=A0A6P5Y716_DURZI|nr:MDIS1-interacting receptor like kinase 2-like [Durio zibethinus]